MESTTLSLPSHEAHRQDSLISFERLSPDLEDPGQYSLHAVVTLVWPYSSSNRAFSLLLAEPDSRLRKQNGQVRVTFRGLCAEQVARTKVGIGDKVTLSLQGARWTENEKLHSTPGKPLEWELQFTNRVKLEAVRNDQVLAVLDVDSPPPPEIHAIPTTPSASALNIDGWPSGLVVTEKWDTPAFLRSKRLSSESSLQSGFGPFGEEEDGYIPGKGRKRPRFSFPSGGWRLVDEPDTDEPANEDNWFESDEEELQRDDEDVPVSGEPIQEGLSGPDASSHLSLVDAGPLETTTEHQSLDLTPTPSVTTDKVDTNPISIQIQSPEEATFNRELLSKQPSLPTDTPRLHPLPSPGLATPSPITSTPANSLGYFFQAPPPPQSSQFLAPTTTNDQKLDNIPTSSYAYDGTVSSDISEATQYEKEGPENGESNVESQSRFEVLPATSGFTSTTQFEPQDTVFRAPPGSSIPPFADEPNDYLATEVEGSLPIDPSISHSHEEYNYEQQEAVDQDMEVEDEHTEISNSRYENAFEKSTELSVEYTDDVDLPPQSQLDWSGRDAENTSHAFEERTVAGIHSENIEEENESVGNDAYNVPTEEYHTVSDDASSDDASSDGMEDHEETHNDEREYEAEEDDEEMSEELEDNVESDSDLDDEVHHNPPPQRNVYPEVIVLDSDSEDEPSPRAQQSSPQYDDVSDDDENDISADVDECAEYQSAEELDDEAADQMEARSEASSGHDLNEQFDGENSDDEIAEDNISDHGSIVEDESIQVEDEQPEPTAQDEAALVEQNDTSSYRSTSKEAYEASIHSEQPSIHSTPKTAHEILSLSEDERTRGRDYEKNGTVSSSRSQSPDSTPRSVGSNTIKLTHETRPLATRTRPLPTPQPTQDEEQTPIPIVSSPDAQIEHEGSIAGNGLGEEYQDPDKASLHQWTDGSGDENHSPEPDTVAQIPGIEAYGHALEDDTAPDDHNDGHDEVVLVGDWSTPKSAESKVYVEATESTLERASSTPSPQTDKPPRRTLVELDDCLGAIVDIIAIVVEVSSMKRAISGSMEYYLSLRIIDATMAGTTVAVHIFNPDKVSLPVVAEEDVLVLRKFKIQDFDHSTAALSGDSSAWAVFGAGENEPTVAGPPVELDEDEYRCVNELRDWYHRGGSAMAADYMLQASIGQEQQEYSPSSVASSDVGSPGSAPPGSSQRRPRRKKSHRRITIHELRDGRRYTEIGSSGGNDSIHELRDGTVYAHSFE
ncbi:Serine-aspartate repeat-containing protein I [Talaromyces islandicus]|uniref:Serine-aspartate repeat-containing protein I n=1 Tax=Talaromyces islandicus TaxID=28573 RepID=A0A0U1LVF8_TALIS|nr:Serine-aspartate repeat-containing protein I [Talaromyces islandicus]